MLVSDASPARLVEDGWLGAAGTTGLLCDLAALTSVYRVVSFVGLGLVLLLAAGLWQRMRPRALPDLREVPGGVQG